LQKFNAVQIDQNFQNVENPQKLGEVTALQRLGSKVFVALPQENREGCADLFVLECFSSCLNISPLN